MGKNPAWAFRNEVKRNTLLKAVSFSKPVILVDRSQAWSPKKLFFLMTTFLHSPGCPQSGKTLDGSLKGYVAAAGTAGHHSGLLVHMA